MKRQNLSLLLVILVLGVATLTLRHVVLSPAISAVECWEGNGFAADGVLWEPGASGADDVARVGAIEWGVHEGCERVIITFERADGEAVESVADASAELLRDLGILRIRLPSITAGGSFEIGVTEAEFPDGEWVRAAYVVQPFEGGRYVDLHFGAPAEGRVRVEESPARVVVDLRAAEGEAPVPSPAGGQTVVLSPLPGEASYPLTVTGYSRTFESNVVVRLEHEGEVVYESFTTANGWLEAWGEYKLVVPDGPTGWVTLHAGDYSAKDGSWSGVAIELTMLP